LEGGKADALQHSFYDEELALEAGAPAAESIAQAAGDKREEVCRLLLK